MGIIFDIKRYAIHDGPGIRTTVFLKGCPLNCLWCQNPEGIRQERELMWRQERCTGCGECRKECPADAISFGCGLCVENCLTRALLIVGEEMPVEEVIKEIERDCVFYDESGGGVTLSGGEPLMQPAFSRAFLKACKILRIHTTIDTCGYASYDMLSNMGGEVDLILYDLKMIDEEKHIRYTGVSNQRILDNLKQLSRNGSNLMVRCPLIPGVNDDEQDIEELGVFVSSLQKVPEISILPYHSAGAEKTKRLTYIRETFHVSHPSSLTMDEIEKRLKSFGLNIQAGA